MDILSAIIVVVPLITPMGEANLELGYLTPPVGMNLSSSSRGSS